MDRSERVDAAWHAFRIASTNVHKAMGCTSAAVRTGIGYETRYAEAFEVLAKLGEVQGLKRKYRKVKHRG